MSAEYLSLERFREGFYDEYRSWFADPELNRRLGPMDSEWLQTILEEPEDQGITWAIFDAEEMVGVLETVFGPDSSCAIAAIAVKPSRRREGFGRAILRRLYAEYRVKGVKSYVAYVERTNSRASGLLISEGFRAISEPNEKGYQTFRRH